jgi:hypothetical protein
VPAVPASIYADFSTALAEFKIISIGDSFCGSMSVLQINHQGNNAKNGKKQSVFERPIWEVSVNYSGEVFKFTPLQQGNRNFKNIKAQR